MNKTTTTTGNQNKRLKQCNVCDGDFTDNTRPNNKKVCSEECRREARNARRRRNYREANPYQPNQWEEFYYDHHEFPFWNIDEKTAFNNMRRDESPHSTDDIESIQSAKQRYNAMGGRKSGTESIDYDGDEGGTHGVSVRLVESCREPGKVTTYTLGQEEFKAYLAGKN